MKAVHALIEKLYKEAKDKIVKKLAQDKGQYQELCKNLLVQVRQYIFWLVFIVID